MLSEKLKELREEYDLSQAELSEIIGIAQTSIGNYERGERIPDADVLLKYADYFKVSTDWLLDRVHQRTVISEDKFIEMFEGLSEVHKNCIVKIQRDLTSCLWSYEDCRYSELYSKYLEPLSDMVTGDISQIITAYWTIIQDIKRYDSGLTLIREFMKRASNNNFPQVYDILSRIKNRKAVE